MSKVTTKAELETGTVLMPRYNSDGLITAVTVDFQAGDVLMLAHMNEEALMATLKTGEAHYWSRSRQELWHKGATSGNKQKVHDVRIDCDQDAVVLYVEQEGHAAACHTGRRSCFYRSVTLKDGEAVLVPTGCQPLFDPKKVY